MEAIARRTMRQANGYAWMYEHMAVSAKYWDDAINIASGVLGGIVGTAGIVSITTDSASPLWARILQIIVGFLVSILSVLTATWRLGETQMNDVLTQVSYATLTKDLMWQLAQPRKDRQDAREYIRAKLGEIEQLKVSAPIISLRVRHAYNSKFKNNPIYTPEDQWEAIIADVSEDARSASSPSDEAGPAAGAELGDALGEMLLSGAPGDAPGDAPSDELGELSDELGDELGDVFSGDELGDVFSADELGDVFSGDELGDVVSGDELGDVVSGDELGAGTAAGSAAGSAAGPAAEFAAAGSAAGPAARSAAAGSAAELIGAALPTSRAETLSPASLMGLFLAAYDGAQGPRSDVPKNSAAL
jgi:hypothetical protein